VISLSYLKEQLSYNSETGEFWWRVARKGRNLMLPAGTISNWGYRVIMLDRQRYVASRLAWFYMTGEWPLFECDHIDRDQRNDRWANLREASRSENAMNTKTRSDNSSGQRGVCWDNQKLKWKVQISVKGAKRIQKHFVNFDDAVNFYKSKAQGLFGAFEVDEIS
jgi:hypothetical protein